MEITRKLITNQNNFTVGRPGWSNAPFIVWHTYNGAGASLYNWFQNNTSGLSSTFAVFIENDEVKIEQYVDWNDTPHANGNWFANVNSFTVEVQDNGKPYEPRNPRLYDGCAFLANEIIKRYPQIAVNVAGFKKHCELADTGCPGSLDLNLIISKTQELINLENWRKDLKPVSVNLEPNFDFNLYNVQTNKVVKSFKAKTPISIAYQNDTWSYTQYSFDNKINTAFLNEEIYKKEVPIVIPAPVEKPKEVSKDIYKVVTTINDVSEVKEFDNYEDAKTNFVQVQSQLSTNGQIELLKNDIILLQYTSMDTEKTIGEHLKSTTQIAVPVQTVTTFIGVILAYLHPELPIEVMLAVTGLIGIAINIFYILSIKLLAKLG